MLNRTKALNLCLLVIFYALLSYTYFFVISDFYFVQRLELTATFSLWKFVVGSVLALIVIFTVTIAKLNPFIYAFLCIICCVLIFPAIILIQYTHDDWRPVISSLILFVLIIIMSKLKLRFASSHFSEKNSFRLLLITSILGLLPFLIVYAPYIQLKNLFLIDVYQTRALVSEHVDNIYTTYTYQWFAKYIIPAVLILGISYKNKTVVLGSIVAMVFLYLCGANKAVYFGIVMIIIFSYGDYLAKAKYFMLFLITVTVGGLLVFYAFDYSEILRLSVRRLIFIPPIADILYFDFFDSNYTYWSESFMSPWVKYPYDVYHSRLIGEVFFKSNIMNANNGLFSDGFMNFGMTGVVINIFIVTTVLSFFSQLKIHPKFFGLYFLLFISIISSSLTTVFITHGMLFLIFFSQIFLKDTRNSWPQSNR